MRPINHFPRTIRVLCAAWPLVWAIPTRMPAQQKFTIESVTPLDMFPQTAEIEVAAHLRLTGVENTSQN